MLKGIDPLLSPQLLYLLCAMGHRQELAIVDANFAVPHNAQQVVRLDGIAAIDVVKAVLTVFPLDKGPAGAAWRMVAKGDPAVELPIFAEFGDAIKLAANNDIAPSALPSEEFKERVRLAYCIVVTGERRTYGNIVLRKGTVLSPL
jgi:L-fucose mutarotase